MQTIETARLLLRAWRKDDLDDLYEYAKNPLVGPNAGWPPHKNREESFVILDGFMQKNEVWAVVHKADNKVIGSVGLTIDELRSNPAAYALGYVLSADYWGQGYATEAAKQAVCCAFEERGASLLCVRHYSFNARSKRVIDKCGFVYEGTLREASILFDGRVLDKVCYSMTRREYDALER